MARTPRVESNLTNSPKLLALARRRGATLKKGRRHEVQEGALIRHVRRGNKTRTQILDLPHQIIVLGQSISPEDSGGQGRLLRNLLIPVASTREGLTRGNGAKLYTDTHLSILEADKGGEPTVLHPIGGWVENSAGRHVVSGDCSDPTRAFLSSVASTDSVIDMPPGAEAMVVFYVWGHSRPFRRFSLSEAVIEQTAGAKLFIRDTPKEEMRGLPIPVVRGDWVQDNLVWVTAGVVQEFPEVPDHGRKKLLLFSTKVPPEEGDARLFSAFLPNDPRYSQDRIPPNWFGVHPLGGYAPAFLDTSVAIHPAGGVVCYGTIMNRKFSGLDLSVPHWAMTIFKLRVTAAGAATVTDVRTTTTSGALAHLNLDAPEDKRFGYTRFGRITEVSQLPGSAPEDEASYISWGAAITVEYFPDSGGQFSDGRGAPNLPATPIGTNDMYNFFGYQRWGLVVVRENQVVFDTVPEEYQISRYRSSVPAAPEYIGTAPVNQQYVACHLSEGGEFGVSFFVWSEGDGIQLAKWDSIDGFGIWDVDFSEVTDPYDFTHLGCYIMCYRRQTLDEEGAPAGDPGFMVSIPEQNGPGAAYILTAGKLVKYSDFYLNGAKPMGNALTSNESTRDAYQDFTPPEED